MGVSATSHPSLGREVGGVAFGLDAAGYHQARLAYPDQLYDELFAYLPTNPSILEIGAGSGLVTQSLLKRDPRKLVAIEPDPALVSFTERRLADARLTMIPAAFPDASIDGEFDLVACAAAFHWMEPSAALERVRQLLAPNGMWAMWWHSYRNPGRGDELADQITPLLREVALPPSDTLFQHYSLDEQYHRETLARAGFKSVEYRLYSQKRQLTTAQVIALYQSYSYVRMLPEEMKTRLIEEIANLVDQKFDGLAPNLVLTPLYFALK
jgi:SAM-dependent methyltransferase